MAVATTFKIPDLRRKIIFTVLMLLVFRVIAHIGDEIRQVHPIALGLALSSLTICLVLPKLWPKVPAPLAAVILPALAVALFHLDVPAVGEMPRALPMKSTATPRSRRTSATARPG